MDGGDSCIMLCMHVITLGCTRYGGGSDQFYVRYLLQQLKEIKKIGLEEGKEYKEAFQ